MLTVEYLSKLAEQQKLSHAYVFSGNATTQKEKIIADFLLNLRIQVADQIQVEPEENEISIKKIRQLGSFFSMSAWNSPYKIAIIKGAHTMNKEAQSAFLKFLEEPKGNAIFFLLVDHSALLLGTIVSRCQEFKFHVFDAAKNEVAQKDFHELQAANIASRFAIAKSLADTPAEISTALEHWLAAARQCMLEAVKKNTADTSKMVRAIKSIQEVSLALQTSNTNPRLALERLMFDL